MCFDLIPLDIKIGILDFFDDYRTFYRFKRTSKQNYKIYQTYCEKITILPEYIWLYTYHTYLHNNLDSYKINHVSLVYEDDLITYDENPYDGITFQKSIYLRINDQYGDDYDEFDKKPEKKYGLGLYKINKNQSNIWIQKVETNTPSGESSSLDCVTQIEKYFIFPECSSECVLINHNYSRDIKDIHHKDCPVYDYVTKLENRIDSFIKNLSKGENSFLKEGENVYIYLDDTGNECELNLWVYRNKLTIISLNVLEYEKDINEAKCLNVLYFYPDKHKLERGISTIYYFNVCVDKILDEGYLSFC